MSQTNSPPTSDVEYVLGLSAERKTAVLSALIRELAGERTDAVIGITTADGYPIGNFRPHSPELLAVVAGLSPESQAMMLAPLPPDFDPDDYLSDEEMEQLRAGVLPQPRKSAPAVRGGVSTSTRAVAATE